jgi:hypothetical protein
MERFDALFANRYCGAYDAFRAGRKPSKSWQIAFGATRSGQLITLQDLLVGINALLGRLVANPVGLVARVVSLIRETESKDVPAIMDALGAIVPPVG